MRCATLFIPLVILAGSRPGFAQTPLPYLDQVPNTPAGRQTGPRPLSLDAVLVSVERFYPAIRAAEQERAIAEGRLLAAQGVFDTNLTIREAFNTGTYDNNRLILGLEQPTPLLGISVFGGYRLGTGTFPVYYEDRKTAEGGEFNAGLAIPLLRDRAIDRRRASLEQAQIDRGLAEPTVRLRRLDIIRAASRAYWAWVAAGQQLLIAEEILSVASRRESQLRELVQAQKLGAIALTDNRRIIVDRQARVVNAQRVYQQAALVLSLYLRDEMGAPRLPCPDEIPLFPEAVPLPSCEHLEADREQALRARPELETLRLQRERVLVDYRVAENAMLPGLGLVVRAAEDVGKGKKGLDRNTYEAALTLDVPLQRRDARGRMQAALARLAQIDADEQLARDRVVTEWKDALSDLERALDLRTRARENHRLARAMELAERDAFQANKSDLLRLNIREREAAEAQVLEIIALAQYHRALADYRAVIGLDQPPHPHAPLPAKPQVLPPPKPAKPEIMSPAEGRAPAPGQVPAQPQGADPRQTATTRIP